MVGVVGVVIVIVVVEVGGSVVGNCWGMERQRQSPLTS